MLGKCLKTNNVISCLFAARSERNEFIIEMNSLFPGK